MTRGRRPLVALREAYEIALKRGEVLLVSEGRYDHFHFIIFQKDRVVFVKVKRTLTNTDDPREILDNYERDVRHIARVPLNDVDARELWARSPRGSFFFFRIERDRILRLLSDGAVVTGAEYSLAPEKGKATQKSMEDPVTNESPGSHAPDPAEPDPAGDAAPKKSVSKRKGKNPVSGTASGNPGPDPAPPEDKAIPVPRPPVTPVPTGNGGPALPDVRAHPFPVSPSEAGVHRPEKPAPG